MNYSCILTILTKDTVNGTPIATSARSCDGICNNATPLVCSKHTGRILANRDKGGNVLLPTNCLLLTSSSMGVLRGQCMELQSAGRLDGAACFHGSLALNASRLNSHRICSRYLHAIITWPHGRPADGTSCLLLAPPNNSRF